MIARYACSGSSMHTRGKSGDGVYERAEKAGVGVFGLRGEELEVVELVGEQGAVPVDQIGRFMGCSVKRAMWLVKRLEAAGYVEWDCFLVGDDLWVWLTERGARLSRTGGPTRRPRVASLGHRRAVNEVRLYLGERCPEGRWVCERLAFRQREGRRHYPDGVLEIDGVRHAIEVELSRRRPRKAREVVEEHSGRFDAVVYFCGVGTYEVMRQIKAEGCWPKLVVCRIPGGVGC